MSVDSANAPKRSFLRELIHQLLLLAVVVVLTPFVFSLFYFHVLPWVNYSSEMERFEQHSQMLDTGTPADMSGTEIGQIVDGLEVPTHRNGVPVSQ